MNPWCTQRGLVRLVLRIKVRILVIGWWTALRA